MTGALFGTKLNVNIVPRFFLLNQEALLSQTAGLPKIYSAQQIHAEHIQVVSGGRKNLATSDCCISKGRMCVCVRSNLDQTMVVNGVIRVIPIVLEGRGTTHTHTLWTVQRAHVNHAHPTHLRSENIKGAFDFLCLCVMFNSGLLWYA